MPKTPIDYSKTAIYKIVCNDLNITDLYVGHTTDFTKRKNQHKTSCNNVKNKKHNLKVYRMIRENGNWENWTMIEIEKYPCDDGNEAGSRERYWYEVLSANLNSNVPNRSDKEYREDNREKAKEYRENNKDKTKEYYENNKDNAKKYQKEHYENNKEMIAQKHKVYYENNKEMIDLKTKEKFTCECGGKFTRINKNLHFRTLKHQTYCNSTILDI